MKAVTTSNKELMIVFRLGLDRYAIPSRWVHEIIPRVGFKTLPKAPEYVAGLFSYRGQILPIFVICALIDSHVTG